MPNPLQGKTILQVIPDLGAGGAERTTLEVSEALVAAGANALVASAGGRLESGLLQLGGELVRNESLSSKNPLTIHRNAGWLADTIRSRGVDIIHARSRAPGWSAYWASKRTGIPFVTTYHGTYNAKTSFKRWYNSVMARGHVVIANSKFIADHVSKTYPQVADRVVAIPRGVDLQLFNPETVTAAQKSAMFENWFGASATRDETVVLLPGRLTRWKGQEDAIEAIRILASRGITHIKLVLAGDDQGREDFRLSLVDQMMQAGLGGHIYMVGHCEDMPTALSLADIVIAPSRDPEAFGRVAAEAGAMGKPVIVSDHGGQKETVVHEQTGLRVPPKDPQALADAIATIMAYSPDEISFMTKSAQSRITQMYSKNALQTATLGVYARVCERGNA